MSRSPEHKLLNIAMPNGIRQFASLPESRSWWALRDHLARLPGVTITDFVTDGVTEAWIDFTYRGHSFTITTSSESIGFSAINRTALTRSCPKS
jgi:hypothetical protein